MLNTINSNIKLELYSLDDIIKNTILEYLTKLPVDSNLEYYCTKDKKIYTIY